jgi:hypothetical protein
MATIKNSTPEARLKATAQQRELRERYAAEGRCRCGSQIEDAGLKTCRKCRTRQLKYWKPKPKRTEAERFWAKVDKGQGPRGDCWFWPSPHPVTGYGSHRFRGKNALAHRVSWTLTFGDIPTGLCVCHKCDAFYPQVDIAYRRCVRPDHLFLGTQLENTQDAKEKGRTATGAKNGTVRAITENMVREIRRRLASGERQRSVAAALGITRSVVNGIGCGKTYLWVE